MNLSSRSTLMVLTHATLMSWLPGQLLGRRLTTANMFKMGRLFAELHAHGHSWTPPSAFSRRRFDRVLTAASQMYGSRSPTTTRCALMTSPSSRMFTSVSMPPTPHSIRAISVSSTPTCTTTTSRSTGASCARSTSRTRCGVTGFVTSRWRCSTSGTKSTRQPMTACSTHSTADTPPRSSWPNGDLTLFQLGRYIWRLNWVARHQSDAHR